jgi:hypothetical protein
LLENAAKPLLVLDTQLPDDKTAGLIKKTNSALGLRPAAEEDAISFFKRLDEAKKILGSKYLAVAGSRCLWETPGREEMFGVISEVLKAKYGTEDMANLFSATFLRVLSAARGEEPPRPYAYIPF